MKKSYDLWIPVLAGILVTFGSFLAGPFIPAPLVALGAFTLIKRGLKSGRINKPQMLDYIILGILSLIMISVYFILLRHSINSTPLWKILAAGIVADIIAYFLGKAENIIDNFNQKAATIISFSSAVLVFFIVSWIVGGGIAGIVIGGIAAAGTAIPGPVPVTTITFLLLYFLINFIDSKVRDLFF